MGLFVGRRCLMVALHMILMVSFHLQSNLVQFIEGQTHFSTSLTYQNTTSKHAPNMESVVCKTTNSQLKTMLS